MRKSQITLAAQLESLAIFRDFIDSVCKGMPGLDESAVHDLKLAVDEACTNIITHGYAGMNPGSIILACQVDGEQAQLSITDFGRPFEPRQMPAPDVNAVLEERPLGGFGLYFIYNVIDAVDYETSEDGNILHLTKFLPVKAG